MIISSPYWLILCFLCVIPWIGPWRSADKVQAILRSLMFLALVLALSKPHFVTNETQIARILIVDRTASVNEDERQKLTRELTELSNAKEFDVIALGDPLDATLADRFKSVRSLSHVEAFGDSPLANAVEQAQLQIPTGIGGMLLVASDSLGTDIDDYRGIEALRSRKIPVHRIELASGARSPYVVGVHWFASIRKGNSSRVLVRLGASEGSGKVSLEIEDKELVSAGFTESAVARDIELAFEPPRSGFVSVVVRVESSEFRDEYAVRLPVQEPWRLLYLSDKRQGGSERLAEAIGPGFDVVSVTPSDTEGLRRELADADLVMLDDLSAASLPQEAEQAIVGSVQSDGLGLVMSGGRAAFGGGGWHRRPVENLLPIELVQKEEKRDPSTSLVIVIDTSGSMSGVRVQLAKEVARLAMRRLLPHDKVGIVEFYGAKRWAAPLQPASNSIELQRALNRMDAGGGTVILPALEEAFYGLQNVDTRYKHVLVLTDGGVESGDFESLMRRMSSQGINVSTVLAGGGYHSEFLVNIANWGKGRFYNVPNRFNLPEILLKQPSTTKLPAYRPGQHAVQARGGLGWWGDVDVSQLGPLAGYVESKPRVGSEVLLETKQERHPVLSTWRYGLGRVTTLTTEPLGEGTEPWQSWSGYGRALARILERGVADGRDAFQYHVEHDGAYTLLRAVRQVPRLEDRAEPQPYVQQVDPDTGETTQSIEFFKRSPDEYVAYLPKLLKGEIVMLETSATDHPDRVSRMMVSSPIVEEERVDAVSATSLSELSAVTGGKQVKLGSDLLDLPYSEPTGASLWSPSPWLFGVALLLFLTEILWRRIPKIVEMGTGVAAALLMVGCLGVMDAEAATPVSDGVCQQATDLVEAAMKTGAVEVSDATELYRQAVLADGSIGPLLEWLAQTRKEMETAQGIAAAELEAHLAAKRGDLQRAADVLTELIQGFKQDSARLDLRIWQAKLFDALGEVDKAKEVYQSLTNQDLNDQDQQFIRLRLALMGLLGDRESNQSADAKPLIELAKKSKDSSFRNRAANVLAVQNQHQPAIELFTIQGEGTQRFRSASRVTEWAIRAKKRDEAIETAWQAVDSAELKRDRNYALALLVEAYRMEKGKDGLEALLGKFTQRNQSGGAAMSSEMQQVWIGLLRELGKTEQAIELFKSTADQANGFSIEMRRELLEMEGETGSQDRMIESYRELIKAAPNELTWRSGLTQIFLENGQEDQARELWRDYVEKLERGTLLLLSAQALGEFGMDDLAESTIERMVTLRVNHGQALLYWADLQQRRGNVEAAERTLNRILDLKDVGDDVRAELASAYERIGRQDKAIEVIELIREKLETIAEDMEMRLAWLYSEIGDEEKALQQWLALWQKINSIPRRRYVEDRLMTVASRLGTLADIAIELEEKLADGSANDREAGLLVRIYSRVNDSVAATEISEMYMAQSGKNQVEQLQEKGRIYQICNDYWNYEKVIERLIEVDPEGETEYLRQLALSMLERGKAQDARKVLMTLRDADDGKDSIGGEFEAGVLSLVGMNVEAANAYRKGIATHPDRIESYLLLANLLREMGQTDRAVGMFQYLAENAERDDLFTIAIDGLLNMEAKGKVMQWARRITLQRLAGREDKNYLYQLLADLSAEVNDKSGQIRAMENSLAVSGTRRLSVLRECMELSSRVRGGVYYSSSSRGPTNKGNTLFFAFGRRLIGLGELMPPQVFLDLGQAFLSDGDLRSAERTFGMARNLADPRAYQREVAAIFEKSRKIPEALNRYDKLLRTSPSDVALIARVAKLNEQESKDDVAFRFYERGLNLLLSQTPLTTQEESSGAVQYWAANRDAYQMYSEQLLQGLTVTLPDEKLAAFFDSQQQILQSNLEKLRQAEALGRTATVLADSPRIERHTTFLRRIYLAFDRITDLEETDAAILSAFPKDEGLPIKLARERAAWGRYDSVRRLADRKGLEESQRRQMQIMLGELTVESGTERLPPKEMWSRLLPVWMSGDDRAARDILRRVDQTRGRAPGARPTYVIVNGMAVMQETGSAFDVAAWMRLARHFGDDNLALQFARSRLKSGGRYGGNVTQQLFSTYRKILPPDSFGDLVRFAANTYKDEKYRLADYLWLTSQMSEYLQDSIPDDSKILELVEDSDLQINYYFPFGLAMDTFPNSIRADALAEVLSRLEKKRRPQELVRIPFVYDKPIDEATGKALLESIASGIAPAMQDNYLRYSTYSLPRNGQSVQCKENVELAIQVLDLLMQDDVQKREPDIVEIARNMKAIVLHQAGQTDQAVELIIDRYDSDKTPTDYYARNSRDWAIREIVPERTERFLAVLDGKAKDKPTAAEISKRLRLVLQSKDEKLIRDAYLTAIQQYPDNTSFTRDYERWEMQGNRKARVLEFYQGKLSRLLEAAVPAKDDEKQKRRAEVGKVHAKLSELWFSVNHRPNGIEHWLKKDAIDREKFESAKKREAETKDATAEAKASKAEGKSSKEATKSGSAKKLASGPDGVANESPGKGNEKEEKHKKTYPASIAGVKSAIDDEDFDSARQTLRKLWRTLPPAVASPYGYRAAQKPLNNLYWPDEAKVVKDTDSSKPNEEEKKAAAEKARQRQRGGVATFAPPKPKPRKERISAWKELAKYPFAIEEMNRIMRSQASSQIRNVQSVSLGLLEFEKREKGEDATLAGLIEKVRVGDTSDETLMQLFAILEDKPERLGDDDTEVVDLLLDRLDLTNVTRARQLADVCARVGQSRRASSLYRHCALLTASSPTGLSTLLTKAKSTFEGDDLMQLAESMFELTNQAPRDLESILQLRMDLLSPEEAAERSRSFFDGELRADTPDELACLITAVQLFSRSGDHSLAQSCLATVMIQHGKPKQMNSNPYTNYYPSNNGRNLHNISRASLIQMFPKPELSAGDSGASTQNAGKEWLAAASQTINGLVGAEGVDQSKVVETLLAIALRQCEYEDREAAQETLDVLNVDLMSKAPGLEPLAMDVMRMSGSVAKALAVGEKLFHAGQLSHLRLGDYLRDVNVVRGQAAAASLLEQLINQSMDQDLMLAAKEIAEGNREFSDRVQELNELITSAESEYKERQAAAKERVESKAKDMDATATPGIPKP